MESNPILDRANEPLHEITREAIEDVLKKYPRKKTVFKEYCAEYKLLDLDEFDEALGLEVLEVMDSKSYIQAMRSKEKHRIEQQKLKIKHAVENYFLANKDDYVVLSSVEYAWIFAKKIKLIVYNKNSNSVFQPYETNEEKTFFTVYIVKTQEEFEADKLMINFMSRGCRIIRVYDDMDVIRQLDALK